MTDAQNNPAQGEGDNAFAGGVGDDLPGGEQPNLEQQAEEAQAAPAVDAQGADGPTSSSESPAEPGVAARTQGGADAPASDSVDGERPDTKLAAERLDDLKRVQAEYMNYRNRVERDRAREKDATIGSVLESLVPVLDDIELARQHGDLTDGPMSKIADKIETTLTRFGVARFGEVGEGFDPNVHEALMHVEAEAPVGVDGTFVVQVLQPGYKVGDRIVRAARVSVAG